MEEGGTRNADVRELLEDQKSALKERVETLEAQDEKEEVQQRLEGHKTEEATCKETIQGYQDRIRELNQRQAAAQGRLESILLAVRSQELPTLQEALATSTTEKDTIETQYIAKQGEIDAEKQRFSDLKRQVTAKQATRREEIDVLKEELRRNPENTDLQPLIRQKSLERHNAAVQLRQEQGTHRQNLARLTGELHELQGNLQAAIRKVKRDTQDIADKEFVLEMEAIPHQITQLKSEVEDEEGALAEIRDAISLVEQNLKELQKEALKAEPLRKTIDVIKTALKVHKQISAKPHLTTLTTLQGITEA